MSEEGGWFNLVRVFSCLEGVYPLVPTTHRVLKGFADWGRVFSWCWVNPIHSPNHSLLAGAELAVSEY